MGKTRPQWPGVSLLRHHKGINQGGLAELLEVEPITAGRMIDRLQEAGLVERRPDPADRRAWLLFLTGRGQELVDQLLPFAHDTLESALDGITEPHRRQLEDALTQMRANLSRRIPAEVAERQ